jgi:hypothetical protein
VSWHGSCVPLALKGMLTGQVMGAACFGRAGVHLHVSWRGSCVPWVLPDLASRMSICM